MRCPVKCIAGSKAGNKLKAASKQQLPQSKNLREDQYLEKNTYARSSTARWGHHMSDRDIGYAVAALLIELIASAIYFQRICETVNAISRHFSAVDTGVLANTPNQLIKPASDKRLAAGSCSPCIHSGKSLLQFAAGCSKHNQRAQNLRNNRTMAGSP